VFDPNPVFGDPTGSTVLKDISLELQDEIIAKAEETAGRGVEPCAEAVGLDPEEMKAWVTGMIMSLAMGAPNGTPDPQDVALTLALAVATGVRHGQREAADLTSSVQADIDSL
jgi:hypothetical protein